MKKILILLILSLIINLINGNNSCNRDYECGNYPYAACNGGLNLGYGIVYNSNDNKLIVSGKYNSSDSGPFGYPYIFSLDTSATNNGSEATLVIKSRINGEILNTGQGFTTFYRVYQYAPIHNYLYLTFYHSGSTIYGIYDQATSSIKQVLNIWGIPFTIDFNKEETKTVYGEYGIYFIDKIPTEKSDFSNSTLLYQNQITNGIILGDDSKNIYISTYDGKFYLGTTDCRNCTQDKLKLLFTDSNVTSISGFLLVGDMIYYSNENGIKAFKKDGSSSSPIVLTNDSISSMTTDGKNIYYIVTGTTTSSFTNNAVVKSIPIPKVINGNITTETPTIIYTPKSDHQCQCAVGFQGDKCQTCNGKTLWNNGIPLCTPIDSETGYPQTCFTSQDCSNSQYINCNSNSTCACLPGFTHANNDCICSNGSIVWNNNYPSCIQN
ncbi:hypothetical protein RB653_000169 [Dictyostelium firmibasis]|uniref:EGF-like domain-containing protein n=1 Tax=Dictyostelium firmibasis TaxID=79012 RepID=A0AAN7YU51_9MYCE